jgi:excisionase family DNA binding protein
MSVIPIYYRMKWSSMALAEQLYGVSTMARGPDGANLKRRAYRPAEAARMLGIGRTKFYMLLEAGTIRSVKIDRLRLVPAEAIDEFLANAADTAA